MLGLGRQYCNLEKQQRMSKAINAGEMLAVQNVEVRFPGVLALNKVSLSVNAGEVLGLMGENGAGKSTLLKVLSGVNKPAAGSIHMHGQHRQFANEKDALEAGIAIIYQELHLVKTWFPWCLDVTLWILKTCRACFTNGAFGALV